VTRDFSLRERYGLAASATEYACSNLVVRSRLDCVATIAQIEITDSDGLHILLLYDVNSDEIYSIVRYVVYMETLFDPNGGGMPSIAVVMATFNGEEWLDTQLQSLANQTRLPDRLVISDDGSIDDTVKISQMFARSAPFEVVLLEGPRAGYGENFWFAGKHAGTDIIAWCDQDDFWYPQKLQLCEQLMVGHGVKFLSHSAMITDAALNPSGQIMPHYRKTRVLEPLVGNPLQEAFGLTTLIRSECLQLVRWEDRPKSIWFDRQIGHDEVVALLSFVAGRRLEVSDVLLSYRQHGRNFVGVLYKPVGIVAHVKHALNTESVMYSEVAAGAENYGRFIAECCPENTKAIDYFAKYQARCLRRSTFHHSPNRLKRMRNIVVALGKGDYGRKERGAFGGLAFARDAVALVVGTKTASV
jgi:glycosyltransferase involved in cell wall biosynthesis